MRRNKTLVADNGETYSSVMWRNLCVFVLRWVIIVGTFDITQVVFRN